MCAAKLKDALKDCLINFDRRVLLTDLVNEYQMPLPVVHEALMDHIAQQEKQGEKYEKRFLVHGLDAQNPNREIYTVAEGDAELRDWLEKLTEAQSSLYSVEIAGGAKPSAEDLKPLRWTAIKVKELKLRTNPVIVSGVGGTNKSEVKTEVKRSNGIAAVSGKAKPAANDSSKSESTSDAKKTTSGTNKSKNAPSSEKKPLKTENDVKKATPPEVKEAKTQKVNKKTSSPEKKPTSKPKKDIGSFFAPTSKAQEKQESSTASTESGVIRQKTPKKLQDFFKKQAETPTTVKNIKKEAEKIANTSIQLFAEEEVKETSKVEMKDVAEAEVDESSTDEEEQLDAIRRKVIGSDEEGDNKPSCSSLKRFRIVDSDDEEDEVTAVEEEEPKQKQSKLDEANTVKDSPPKNEAFLDEEGFVVTIKNKKAQKKAPPKLTKTPVKSKPKESKLKQSPAPTSKTKQGNIMNFFKKK